MLQYRDHAFAAPDGVWPPVEALKAVAEANGVREEPEQTGESFACSILADPLQDETRSDVAWHGLVCELVIVRVSSVLTGLRLDWPNTL